MQKIIVGLKELRENIDAYIKEVKRGKTFIIARKSKPVFKISPPDEDNEMWERVIDFTKVKNGGIGVKDLLSRL